MSTYPPSQSAPFAPERNPTIEPQYYKPSRFTISAIGLGATTTVTVNQSSFGVNDNYTVGQLVRFTIPPTYGTRQLDQMTGYVISLPTTNQFVVNINSTFFTPFVSSPSYGPTPPQVVGVGDVNTGTTNASGRANTATAIPGSFINTSPASSG